MTKMNSKQPSKVSAKSVWSIKEKIGKTKVANAEIANNKTLPTPKRSERNPDKNGNMMKAKDEAK